MTEQLTFLGYLVAGQLLLLGAWALLRGLMGGGFSPAAPLPPPSRMEQMLFVLYLLVGQVGLLLGWNVLVDVWNHADRVARADLVVTLHLSFVLTVLVSLILVCIGWLRRWAWVRNIWFRLAHLIAIEIVAGQAIVGLECPLTTLERDLRDGYLFDLEGASALARFSSGVLFYDLPMRTFAILYVVFGLLVLLTWVVAPPRMPGRDYSSISR